MAEGKKTPTKDVLAQIEKLLEDPNCVVRVQRELIRERVANNAPGINFIAGDKVTIIIVGTPKK